MYRCCYSSIKHRQKAQTEKKKEKNSSHLKPGRKHHWSKISRQRMANFLVEFPQNIWVSLCAFLMIVIINNDGLLACVVEYLLYIAISLMYLHIHIVREI
jgi:hypothetical protein